MPDSAPEDSPLRRSPAAERLDLATAQGLWDPVGPYLNTASYGLPPTPAFEALQAALADWRRGRTSWEHWGDSSEGSRAAFARIVGVATESVAISATVSELVGQIAASLPDGARVVLPEIEFTSLLFPFLAHADRGVEVRTVPLDRLAEAVDAETSLVACSAVQSATGELADLDAVLAAARHHGALTAIDATQACGWLPIDAAVVDFCVCGAYKWLGSPRGTAFLAIRPAALDAIRPHSANWYAGEDPHTSYYGPPLRLANSARRLDTSPAWFSWVGTQPALELLERIGIERIQAHDVGLANRFRAGLGLEVSDSAIVSAEVPDAERRLREAGILASVRKGSLRAAFHVYNTEADVDRALEALTG